MAQTSGSRITPFLLVGNALKTPVPFAQILGVFGAAQAVPPREFQAEVPASACVVEVGAHGR
jgi:hypothetical protein